MTTLTEQLEHNLGAIRSRIDVACANAERDPEDVTLIAVTKYAEPEWVQALVELGMTELGESRPQQLVERVEQFPPSVRWHLIGHLQRNKARKVLPLTTLIHSVDSPRLLSAINRLAEELDRRPRVLLEVNVSGEAAKHGFEPAELRGTWSTIASQSRVEIAGLMTMAPRVENPENARPFFRQLRELRDELVESTAETSNRLPELSMGMSGDFEVAIEEGATLVRVGSRLFEGLG